jgi:hypothetical protein
MKKYLSIFNLQTIAIISLSLISAYICALYQFSIYFDFLILNFIIIFPLTFSLGMAFKRREKAIQFLSLFKASLQSVYYGFQKSKLDIEQKAAFRKIAENLSAQLINYLAGRSGNATTVREASHSIYTFTRDNKGIKSSFSIKVSLFLFRMNESIEFLLATRIHRTPWGPRAIALFGIYFFAIFYPASLIHDIGNGRVNFIYIFLSTASKALILISFYNVQALLENPFNHKGTDGIKLSDFDFFAGINIEEEITPISEIGNKNPALPESENDEEE